jgi:hypothetical protein
MGIPSSNLEALELEEVPFKSFRLKKYIGEGVKEYTKNDIISHFLFMNTQFEKDLINIRLLRNIEFDLEDEGRFIGYLRFDNDINSLPLILMQTQNAIKILDKKNDRFVFEFEISTIGLPEMVNVITLMDQLITSCYNIQSTNEFYTKIYSSKNPLLTHFSEVIKERFSERISEVIRLLQRPELDPNITYNDIIYGRTKARLLLFNQYAYNNIFQDFISSK